MAEAGRSLAGIVVAVGMMLCASKSNAVAKSELVQPLAGRYSKHFENAMMDGEKYPSDDVFEVVPVATNAAYIRASLQFTNGHSCDIAGIATVEKDQLVYHQPLSPDFPPPPPSSWDAQHPCVLHVSRIGSKLQLDDGFGSCHTRNCGMRGTLTWDLPFSSRRPITYMRLLKASPQYNQAMAEWGSNH